MEYVESASKEKVIWWVVVSKKSGKWWLGSAKGVGKLDSDVVAWQLWLSLLYSFSSLMAYET